MISAPLWVASRCGVRWRCVDRLRSRGREPRNKQSATIVRAPPAEGAEPKLQCLLASTRVMATTERKNDKGNTSATGGKNGKQFWHRMRRYQMRLLLVHLEEQLLDYTVG
jgi:hypothetical protein